MSNDPSATPSIRASQAVPSSTLAARGPTFASVALFDLALSIDAGLRWEKGFGFARTEWLRDAGLVLALELFVAWLLVRRPSPAWLVAIWAFPSLCVAFMAASAGTSVFDWRKAPVLSFVTQDWSTKLVEQGGFYTAFVGTLAYVSWYGAARRVLRLKPPNARELLLLGLGLGWIVASAIRLADLVSVYPDFRPRSPGELYTVGLARSALWGTALVVGLIAFAAGFYRRQVRGYHKEG